MDTPGVLPELLLQHNTPRPHKAAAEPSEQARFTAVTAPVAAVAALPGCIAAGAGAAAAVVGAAQQGKVQVQHLQDEARGSRCNARWGNAGGCLSHVQQKTQYDRSEMVSVAYCLHAAAIDGMSEVRTHVH